MDNVLFHVEAGSVHLWDGSTDGYVRVPRHGLLQVDHGSASFTDHVEGGHWYLQVVNHRHGLLLVCLVYNKRTEEPRVVWRSFHRWHSKKGGLRGCIVCSFGARPHFQKEAVEFEVVSSNARQASRRHRILTRRDRLEHARYRDWLEERRCA